MRRFPDWDVRKPDLTLGPAAGVYETAESADMERDVPPIYRFETNIQVELHALARGDSYDRSVDLALDEIYALMGLVRAAVAAANQAVPKWDDAADDVRYIGCEQPRVTDLPEAACEASIAMNFVLLRQEAETSPYAHF